MKETTGSEGVVGAVLGAIASVNSRTAYSNSIVPSVEESKNERVAVEVASFETI